jgi:hypothetical protein
VGIANAISKPGSVRRHVQASQVAYVNIDTDADGFASTYANAKGIPLGAAISELLRRAEQSLEPRSSMLRTNHLGFIMKAKTSQVVTPEMVKDLLDDELDEGSGASADCEWGYRST